MTTPDSTELTLSPTAHRIIDALTGVIEYSDAQTSFSPMFSNIGLIIDAKTAGISRVCFHYNRKTVEFGAPFLGVNFPVVSASASPLSVKQSLARGAALSVAFFAKDSFIVETTGVPSLQFQINDPSLTQRRKSRTLDGDIRFIEGYLPTSDPRDPDETFPIVIGVRATVGDYAGGDGLATPLMVNAAPDGRIVLAFAIGIIEPNCNQVAARAGDAPDRISAAESRTAFWLNDSAGNIDVESGDATEAQALATAALTLLSNTARAPGIIRNRCASFCNRGVYPAQFLWDACFHNLALETMKVELARDALTVPTENIRIDGKIAQFVVSTWQRPKESQPPLLGWAAYRYLKTTNDIEFARWILQPLLLNTIWWLSQRMTAYGLIQTATPVETGWDNTPRFDQGPVIACDMNSYLLSQIRSCAEIAARLDDEPTALAYYNQADAFARNMMDVLYDKETNSFRDVLVSTGEPVKVSAPSQFLPLWAGVPIDESDARRLLSERLLNPDAFFGIVPFPSVAYNDPLFEPGNWWRGPVWPPVVWLMLETLDKYGFDNERRDAMNRIVSMLVADGQCHELFNAKTGEGLGSKQQSWTAALLLAIRNEQTKAKREERRRTTAVNRTTLEKQ